MDPACLPYRLRHGLDGRRQTMARAKVTRTSYKQDSRIVQALAYGDLGNITESFFDKTVRATSEHRLVVLVLCGLVGDAAFANSTIIPFG